MRHRILIGLIVCAAMARAFAQQDLTVVKPVEIDDVLNNPGIGFMTFQRFNGDLLNQGIGWTEGFPIDYQVSHGLPANKDYPMTSIAYLRIYWRFIEPEKGQFAWSLIDKALSTARERGQTLMLRIAPYGSDKASDVPEWYRKEIREAFPAQPLDGWKGAREKWATDAENPAYAREFGGMIHELGTRYDGDPDLEAVDLSIVGAWGEGAGTEILTRTTLESLLDGYLDSFHRTPLLLQLTDKRAVSYALTKAGWSANPSANSTVFPGPPIGWRADCLGDLGGFSPTENHMTDIYPEAIIGLGLSDAWKTAPVSLEACWVMQGWKDRGWSLKYIMGQAVKWHASSFNGKSSPVPAEWQPEVNDWLKRMGYRFALRRLTYSSVIGPNRKLQFTSWWENKGNAPAYRGYRLALRLKREGASNILITNANVKDWMPGDSLYNDSVFLPPTVQDGDYELSLALLDPLNNEPKIRLAIAGIAPDGWYSMGKIKVHASDKAMHETSKSNSPKAVAPE